MTRRRSYHPPSCLGGQTAILILWTAAAFAALWFGHGAESLNDYIEGLSTGLRIANPKKTLKIDTEVLP